MYLVPQLMYGEKDIREYGLFKRKKPVWIIVRAGAVVTTVLDKKQNFSPDFFYKRKLLLT